MSCLDSSNYTALGSWCLAGALKYIDVSEFKDALTRCMKVQHRGIYGLDKLVDISVRTTISMPSPVRADVLSMLLDALANVSTTSVDYLQGYLFNKYWQGEQGATLESRATLCSLVNDVLQVNTFSKLVGLASIIYKDEDLLDDLEATSSESYAAASKVDVRGMQETSIVHASLNSSSSAGTGATGEGDVVLPLSLNLEGLEAERRIVVQELLRREFNYDDFGVKMKESANDVKLRRALETISSDLYSEDVHFVMELVQNADDNKYDDGVVPSLRIELKKDEIIVHNNERGFEEENIFAVCSVGDSTKKVGIKKLFDLY
jgi:hypothetical protein